MYSRSYEDKDLTFEPSGGLLNGSLVMQDKQTDSYWSIMTGEGIGGKFKGKKLKELPVSQKMQWKDWKKLHPNTLVLSVNGKEDEPYNPYDPYFESREGFRGLTAKDRRLETKTPIFAFELNGKKYAVPFRKFEGGNSFKIGDVYLFLYRPSNVQMFYSTFAFKSTSGKGFIKKDGKWHDAESGCVFNPRKGTFEGGGKTCPQAMEGFDTFWYNWSLTNPDTEVLE